MENKTINLNGNKYEIIKTLESDNWIYYYTLNLTQDKEVVILCKNLLQKDAEIETVDEREYPILINKFAKIEITEDN